MPCDRNKIEPKLKQCKLNIKWLSEFYLHTPANSLSQHSFASTNALADKMGNSVPPEQNYQQLSAI